MLGLTLAYMCIQVCVTGPDSDVFICLSTIIIILSTLVPRDTEYDQSHSTCLSNEKRFGSSFLYIKIYIIIYYIFLAVRQRFAVVITANCRL